MGYFPVRYDSRVVIYKHKMVIRLCTGLFASLMPFRKQLLMVMYTFAISETRLVYFGTVLLTKSILKVSQMFGNFWGYFKDNQTFRKKTAVVTFGQLSYISF